MMKVKKGQKMAEMKKMEAAKMEPKKGKKMPKKANY